MRILWLTAAAACVLFAAAGTAIAREPGVHGTKPTTQTTRGKTINLATYSSKRWIVQLKAAPLATYRGGVSGLRATSAAATGARLNTSSSQSRAYLRYLRGSQHVFSATLRKVVPRAHVLRSYQVVLNGLAVKMNRNQAVAVRKLRGVRAVTPDIPYRLQMFSSPAQIGAPVLWAQLGGQSHAGEGVKVAVIDSGIFVRRDASGAYAGNPCFDDVGYTAPPGYPKGDTRFTNNKVIVARAYFRPDDPPAPGNDTPIQGPDGSPHGTHTAGTVACNAGTTATIQDTSVSLSGIAPRAFLMNYRVFYPSTSPEDFQNGNAYVVELVKAIDDAVKDGADVVSNSWGASYQNTLAWPDPMIQAAERAVAAGVTMVFANSNAGPDTATASSPAISPKVIAVGASTKDTTIVPGDVSVTAPTPVPANLTGMPVGPADFGPQDVTQLGPALYVPVETVASNGSPLACPLADGSNPLAPGSLAGKIALISRGTCEFSTKVLNAQQAGAIAALIYNSAANGDNIQSMGAGAVADQVTIPSWFMRRSQGLAMVAFATANPGAAEAQFTRNPHVTSNIGDVMAGFSSRGPSQDKLIKPDVVAPGVDIISSGYAVGDFPIPFIGFGSSSGTSMATPHVAGSAALLKHLHPNWRPAQIKSALMTTATENVFLDTTQTLFAGVLDRGSGRIDLSKAGNPGLTLDKPSLSAGELKPGQKVEFTIRAHDVSGADSTWDVSTTKTGLPEDTANFDITVDSTVLAVEDHESARPKVTVSAAASAVPGDYEGSVVLVNGATGVRLHVPVWMRVLPANIAHEVLLVDDDGSGFDPSLPDYSAVYQQVLTGLGVDFQYLDVDATPFPPLLDLYQYGVVIVFTGDNASFDTSGFFPSDQNNLNQWLDSGGRLWTSGQNFAEASDSNSDFSSPSLGRARLYHGYLGVKYVLGSAYPGPAPRPTAKGHGPMKGFKLDLSPGADGAGNQASIEVMTPMPDTDTYQAIETEKLFFRQYGGTQPASTGIAYGRSSEPRLDRRRVKYRYRSVSMGFGLEGVNDTTGFTTKAQVAKRTLNWLLDAIDVSLSAHRLNGKRFELTAAATSSVGANFTQFSWDFGDKSEVKKTTSPSVTHTFKNCGADKKCEVKVEVTDNLGHRAIEDAKISTRKH
jgi:minor extracellular serine protease Vpr